MDWKAALKEWVPRGRVVMLTVVELPRSGRVRRMVLLMERVRL